MLVDSLNLSTKFVNSDLGDPINYRTFIHNVSNNNDNPDIPARYQNKERTLKERPSMNSFRIYDTNLKKRTNPSDIYEQEIQRTLEEERQRQMEMSRKPSIQPSWVISNPNVSQKDNLLKVLESQVNLLKEETEANLRLNSSHISNGAKQNNEINNFSSLNEPHVDTHFFNNENGVIQAFKHVKTMNKPEYMSIEQVSHLREINAQKLIELEKEYKKAKDREKLEKFKEEQEKMNKKFNYKPEVLEELKEILKRENELFHFDKKKKKRSKSLKSINFSEKKPEKNINKSEEKYVKKFAKYKVKKKMDRLENEKEMMNNKPWNYTKIESKNIHGVVERDDNLPGYLGKVDLSLYYCDITDPKKNIPEKFKAPHWTSVTRTDLRKEYSLNVENGMIENNEKKDDEKDKKEEIQIDPEEERAKQEELADSITKDIFDYFNQEFTSGLVTKSQIATEFNFEMEELIQLKYTSKKDFVSVLEDFHTDLYNRMNYEELKKCLLTRVHEIQDQNQNQNDKDNDNNNNNNNNNVLANSLKNNILNSSLKKQPLTNSIKNNDLKTPNKIDFDNENNNLKSIKENKDEYKYKVDYSQKENIDNNDKFKENENIDENKDINNDNINEDYYKEEEEENEEENENEKENLDDEDCEDYLPVYNTKNVVIKYDTTEKRLEETNKMLYQLEGPPASTDMEEDSLEIKIDLDVDKDDPKEVNYNDYKKVINKYNDKNLINFTIPKPFSFQADTTSKINGVKKLQKFLISRKEAEDKLINEKFKPNDLKTEMFIGNIDNLMEADKNAKKKRVEKGMKKLKESMRPFSFTPQDEAKQKEKMEKQKIYESTKEYFKPFKAGSIKSTSRGGLNAEERAKNENKERIKRIEKHAQITIQKSKLPPGMAQHEKQQKKKKELLMKEEKKRQKLEEKERKKKKNLDPPNWNKVHKFEEKKLQQKKKINDKIKEEKATKIKEFNLHEGPKKENMYQKYIENGIEDYKVPSLKRNINKFEAEYEKIQNE